MTCLSNGKILKGMSKGTVIIHPFDRDNLGSSSYDVSLGEYFYRERKPVNAEGDWQFFNPYSEAEVKKVWGKCETASKATDWKTHYSRADWEGVSDSNYIIMVPPGETILAHTQEFIGGRFTRTTMMKARSSFGRSFIAVCKCAGWGDVGYINRWTMEITNFSRYYHIPLVVGRRIAQIAFLSTGKASIHYGAGDKYQHGSSLAQVQDNWTPEMMLPGLYKDRDIVRDDMNL